MNCDAARGRLFNAERPDRPLRRRAPPPGRLPGLSRLGPAVGAGGAA